MLGFMSFIKDQYIHRSVVWPLCGDFVIICFHDFRGNEYEQHTKCITEEEKYSGKNYVPKPGSNKNETKQQQWLQVVYKSF